MDEQTDQNDNYVSTSMDAGDSDTELEADKTLQESTNEAEENGENGVQDEQTEIQNEPALEQDSCINNAQDEVPTDEPENILFKFKMLHNDGDDNSSDEGNENNEGVSEVADNVLQPTTTSTDTSTSLEEESWELSLDVSTENNNHDEDNCV